MTRKALTALLYPLATLGLGCADWSVIPLQQPTQPPKSPAMAQTAQPAVDSDLANAPIGDSLDASGDTTAAQAVREYLADLDGAQRPRPAATARPNDAAREPRIEALQAAPALQKPKPESRFGMVEHTPAAAPPAAAPPAVATSAHDVRGPAVKSDAATALANIPVSIEATQPADASTAPADARRPQVVAVSLVGNPEPAAANLDAEATPIMAPNAAADPTHAATLDGLIEQARGELAKKPTDAQAQWRLSLLLLAAGRTADAGAFSPELTEPQRSLLARQVAVNAAVEEVLGGSTEHANEAYAATEALRDALRQDAELVLPVLTLCNKVTTYGVYSELPDSALVPYRVNRAIVYCEVRNLATESDAAGGFRSLLSTRLELFGENGQSLWTHEEKRIDDVARRRREDFFIAQLVTFPPTLAPGEYTLKATITDLIGEKTNEATRTLHIGGTTAAADVTSNDGSAGKK